MADLSFARLCRALLAITPDSSHDSSLPGFAGPFGDAWSIIDSVNRLRPLTLLVPGAKKHPAVRAFLGATEPIRALRDNVQHIQSRVDRLVSQQLPTWGVISWVTLHDRDPVLIRSHVIVAGSVSPGSHRLENPAGQRLRPPMDLVKLTAHGLTVDLGEALRSVAGLVTILENQLSRQFGNLPHAASDVYVAVDIVPAVDDNATGADVQDAARPAV